MGFLVKKPQAVAHDAFGLKREQSFLCPLSGFTLAHVECVHFLDIQEHLNFTEYLRKDAGVERS